MIYHHAWLDESDMWWGPRKAWRMRVFSNGSLPFCGSEPTPQPSPFGSFIYEVSPKHWNATPSNCRKNWAFGYHYGRWRRKL